MRRAAAVVALVLLLAAPAAAQSRRWGVLTGARATTGELQSRYRFGYVLGFESTYMPTWFGLAWSLQYTWFWNQSDPRNVDTLQLIDLDAGLRARLPPFPPFPFYVFGHVGVALIRSSVPLGDELDSSYIGLVTGAGVELASWSPLVLSVSADYTFLSGGPQGFRMLMSIALGSQ